MNELIRIGPPTTMFVVFICIVPPLPVAVMSMSMTAVFTDELTELIRAQVAVPEASADES